MSAARETAHVQMLRQMLRAAQGLHLAGRLDEATTAYKKILKSNPNNADALNLLGVIAQQRNAPTEALSYFDRAIAAMPGMAVAFFNKGQLLVSLGRKVEGRDCYRRAISFAPAYADPRLNLGAQFFQDGDVSAAIDTFRQMTVACPNDARGHFNLGRCLAEAGDVAAAETALRRALTVKNDYVDAWITLAKLYADTDRVTEAIETVRQAVALDSTNALALTNLGTYLTFLDRHEAALDAYDQALRSDPSYVSAAVNKGLALLTCGQFAEGWDGYWHRAETTGNQKFRKLDVPWPRWEGQALAGKSIFVWGEQGLGDEILTAGMLGEVAAEAATCTLGCDAKLVALFQRSFPKIRVAPLPTLLAREAGETYDFHSSLVDLGRWRRRSLASFPKRPSYLIADQDAVLKWRACMDQYRSEGRRVLGFSWRSFAPHIGANKTPPLERWRTILVDENAIFFNFQYGPAPQVAADLDYFRRQFGREIVSIPDHAGAMGADLDILAAQISAMDGIITVSNTTAHLAGALGKPTLIAVPDKKARLWYWLKGGQDSPWYPRVRLWRWAEHQSPVFNIASMWRD